MSNKEFLEAAEKIAYTLQPRWKFWLARMFGTPEFSVDHSGTDYTVVIESRLFRGTLYVIKYRYIKH